MIWYLKYTIDLSFKLEVKNLHMIHLWVNMDLRFIHKGSQQWGIVTL